MPGISAIEVMSWLCFMGPTRPILIFGNSIFFGLSTGFSAVAGMSTCGLSLLSSGWFVLFPPHEARKKQNTSIAVIMLFFMVLIPPGL